VRFAGSILVILSACSFGLMPLFNRWATSGGANTETMLFLRFSIAGAVLAAFMLGKGARWPRGRTLLTLVFMGAILYVGEAQSYFYGLKYAPSGLISLLLYLNPAMITLASRLLYRERLTPPRTLALGLALLGLALTIRLDRETHIEGVLLGLGCAAIYATYLLVGARVMKSAGALPSGTLVIISAACTFGLLAWWRGVSLPHTPLGWSGAVGLALISTVIGIVAMLEGMRRIGAVRASTLATLEPVATASVGALALHEKLFPIQMLGGVLIIMAAIIMTTAGSAAGRARAEPEAHP